MIIYVKLEQPSLDRGGGLRYQLSATFDTVLNPSPGNLSTVHTLVYVIPMNHIMMGRVTTKLSSGWIWATKIGDGALHSLSTTL